MPFKSEKQRRWMHANHPEMAKKWEKKEKMKKETKVRSLIKKMVREIMSEGKLTEAKKPVSFKLGGVTFGKDYQGLKSRNGGIRYYYQKGTGSKNMESDFGKFIVKVGGLVSSNDKNKVAKKLKEGKLTEKAKRDYKTEYKKFQSSDKSKKYRAELNQYNRKKGTYGNGDGLDASHKGGKIKGFEKESVNRGRAEKSRLKKEGKLTEGKFGKFDIGVGAKGNGLTIWDRNQSQGGDYKTIAHISDDGKLTIRDKKVKQEKELMKRLAIMVKAQKDYWRVVRRQYEGKLTEQISSFNAIQDELVDLGFGNLVVSWRGTKKKVKDLKPGNRIDNITLEKINNTLLKNKSIHYDGNDYKVTPQGKKYFKGTLQLEGKLTEATEPLWTKETVKDAINQIKKGLKNAVPYLDDIGTGFGGESIIGKISLDDKKTWPNGYIENSRWALIHFFPNGTLDSISMNGYSSYEERKKVPKLRKSKNKTLKQAIDRMGKYFTVVRLKYPSGK